MFNKETIRALLEALGGLDNVQEVSFCMTRMRLRLVDRRKVDIPQLKSFSFLIAVIEVTHDQLHLLVGPDAELLTKSLLDYRV